MTIRRTGAATLAALILLGASACSTGPDAAETMDSLVDALNRGDVAAVKALAADPDRIADVTPDEPAKLTLRGEVQPSQSDKSKATGVVSWDDGEEMASIPLVRTKEGWRADLGASLPQLKEMGDGFTLGDAGVGARLLPGTYTVDYRSDIGEGTGERTAELGEELNVKASVADAMVLRGDEEASPLIAQRAGDFLESVNTCQDLMFRSQVLSSSSDIWNHKTLTDICRASDSGGADILDASALAVDHIDGTSVTLKGSVRGRRFVFVEYPKPHLGEAAEREEALRAEHGDAICDVLSLNLDDAVRQVTGYDSGSVLCAYQEEADVDMTGVTVGFGSQDAPLDDPMLTSDGVDQILDHLYHGYVPQTEDARKKVENGLA